MWCFHPKYGFFIKKKKKTFKKLFSVIESNFFCMESKDNSITLFEEIFRNKLEIDSFFPQGTKFYPIDSQNDISNLIIARSRYFDTLIYNSDNSEQLRSNSFSNSSVSFFQYLNSSIIFTTKNTERIVSASAQNSGKYFLITLISYTDEIDDNFVSYRSIFVDHTLNKVFPVTNSSPSAQAISWDLSGSLRFIYSQNSASKIKDLSPKNSLEYYDINYSTKTELIKLTTILTKESSITKTFSLTSHIKKGLNEQKNCHPLFLSMISLDKRQTICTFKYKKSNLAKSHVTNTNSNHSKPKINPNSINQLPDHIILRELQSSNTTTLKLGKVKISMDSELLIFENRVIIHVHSSQLSIMFPKSKTIFPRASLKSLDPSQQIQVDYLNEPSNHGTFTFGKLSALLANIIYEPSKSYMIPATRLPFASFLNDLLIVAFKDYALFILIDQKDQVRAAFKISTPNSILPRYHPLVSPKAFQFFHSLNKSYHIPCLNENSGEICYLSLNPNFLISNDIRYSIITIHMFNFNFGNIPNTSSNYSLINDFNHFLGNECYNYYWYGDLVLEFLLGEIRKDLSKANYHLLEIIPSTVVNSKLFPEGKFLFSDYDNHLNKAYDNEMKPISLFSVFNNMNLSDDKKILIIDTFDQIITGFLNEIEKNVNEFKTSLHFQMVHKNSELFFIKKLLSKNKSANYIISKNTKKHLFKDIPNFQQLFWAAHKFIKVPYQQDGSSWIIPPYNDIQDCETTERDWWQLRSKIRISQAPFVNQFDDIESTIHDLSKLSPDKMSSSLISLSQYLMGQSFCTPIIDFNGNFMRFGDDIM